MVPCLVTLADLNVPHGLSAIAEFRVNSSYTAIRRW